MNELQTPKIINLDPSLKRGLLAEYKHSKQKSSLDGVRHDWIDKLVIEYILSPERVLDINDYLAQIFNDDNKILFDVDDLAYIFNKLNLMKDTFKYELLAGIKVEDSNYYEDYSLEDRAKILEQLPKFNLFYIQYKQRNSTATNNY